MWVKVIAQGKTGVFHEVQTHDWQITSRRCYLQSGQQLLTLFVLKQLKSLFVSGSTLYTWWCHVEINIAKRCRQKIPLTMSPKVQMKSNLRLRRHNVNKRFGRFFGTAIGLLQKALNTSINPLEIKKNDVRQSNYKSKFTLIHQLLLTKKNNSYTHEAYIVSEDPSYSTSLWW